MCQKADVSLYKTARSVVDLMKAVIKDERIDPKIRGEYVDKLEEIFREAGYDVF